MNSNVKTNGVDGERLQPEVYYFRNNKFQIEHAFVAAKLISGGKNLLQNAYIICEIKKQKTLKPSKK